MRLDNKRNEVTIRMRIPINEPDCNGNIYSKEAIKNACNRGINDEKPISLRVCPEDSYNTIEIGKITGLEYDEDNSNSYLIAKGYFNFCGTWDTVEMNKDNVVTDMNISCMGIVLE